MNSPQQVDAVFRALADPTRRGLIERLAGATAQARVTELAAPLPMSLNAVSKHLKVLEGAGLVHRRKAGREQLFELAPAALDQAGRWVAEQQRVWDDRMDALACMLDEDASAEGSA